MEEILTLFGILFIRFSTNKCEYRLILSIINQNKIFQKRLIK